MCLPGRPYCNTVCLSTSPFDPSAKYLLDPVLVLFVNHGPGLSVSQRESLYGHMVLSVSMVHLRVVMRMGDRYAYGSTIRFEPDSRANFKIVFNKAGAVVGKRFYEGTEICLSFAIIQLEFVRTLQPPWLKHRPRTI